MHENLIDAVASSATYRVAREEAKRKKRRERKETEQKGQKESPGIMATALRSGLRAPKSKPVSMPRHRHSFEMRCVMRVSPGIASASLRLASASVSGTKLCRRPMPGAVRPRRSPSVHVARVYGCETIGYLLLCIWHIVKLIERDDKIAMFFDVKRGERLAGE